MDTRQKQRLGTIDIANPDHHIASQQGRLDRNGSTGKTTLQHLGVEVIGQRLHPEPSQQSDRRRLIESGRPNHRTEPARVGQPQQAAVGQQVNVIVGSGGTQFLHCAPAHRPRHP